MRAGAAGAAGEVKAACTSFGGVWMYPPWACATPLVLSFDGAPVAFTQPSGSFDLVRWRTGIARDRLGVGRDAVARARPERQRSDRRRLGAVRLDDRPHERRSSAERLRAAELDRDGDGAITPADPAWAALRLWSDADQDRASAPRELRSLDAAGVVSIDLRYRVEPRCVASACEMERARFTWRRGGDLREGAVVDVHFAVR